MAPSARDKIWFPDLQRAQIREYADQNRIPFSQAVRDLAEYGLALKKYFSAMDRLVADHMATRAAAGLDGDQAATMAPAALLQLTSELSKRGPIPMESGPLGRYANGDVPKEGWEVERG